MSITIQKVNDLTPTLTLMMMTVVVLHHQKGYHSQIDSHQTVLCLIAIGTYIAQLVGVFVRSVSQPRARILVYLNRSSQTRKSSPSYSQRTCYLSITYLPVVYNRSRRITMSRIT